MLAQRHTYWLRAELERVDDIARKRWPPAHDFVARIERRLRDAVDQTVGSRADRDLVEGNAMSFRECLPQTVRAAVRVAVQPAGDPRQGFECARKRAVWSFVRCELDDPLES